jgi:hypothetical protein
MIKDGNGKELCREVVFGIELFQNLMPLNFPLFFGIYLPEHIPILCFGYC